MIVKETIFIIVTIFLASCAGKTNPGLSEQMNNSLSASNEFISGITQNEYHELENNLLVPGHTERAKLWQSKAIEVKNLTLAIFNKIDSIKENTKIGTNNFSSLQLSKEVNEYRDNVLRLDSDINKTFSSKINFVQVPGKNFIDTIIINNNQQETITLLTMIQNSILLIENSVVTFCKFRSQPGCVLTFDKTSVLIGQSTTHLKTGEVLEINAGVGAYSMAANPKIMMNGHLIPTINGISAFKEKMTEKKAGIAYL